MPNTINALVCALALMMSGCVSDIASTPPSIPMTSPKTTPPSQPKPQPPKRTLVKPGEELYRVVFDNKGGGVLEVRDRTGRMVFLNDFTCPELDPAIHVVLRSKIPLPPPKVVLNEADLKRWIEDLEQSIRDHKEALETAESLNRICAHVEVPLD